MAHLDGLRVDHVTPNEFFWKMLSAHRKLSSDELLSAYSSRTFEALDPGETTGTAIWNPGGLLNVAEPRIALFQLETKNVGQAYEMLLEVDEKYCPDHVRAEEYRIYNWMADSHAWSILHTPQLIGAIRVLTHLRGRPLTFKLAQHAKAVWGDEVLKRCGLYSPGLKHARDALRHLLFYMAYPERTD